MNKKLVIILVIVVVFLLLGLVAWYFLKPKMSEKEQLYKQINNLWTELDDLTADIDAEGKKDICVPEKLSDDVIKSYKDELKKLEQSYKTLSGLSEEEKKDFETLISGIDEYINTVAELDSCDKLCSDKGDGLVFDKNRKFCVCKDRSLIWNAKLEQCVTPLAPSSITNQLKELRKKITETIEIRMPDEIDNCITTSSTFNPYEQCQLVTSKEKCEEGTFENSPICPYNWHIAGDKQSCIADPEFVPELINYPSLSICESVRRNFPYPPPESAYVFIDLNASKDAGAKAAGLIYMLNNITGFDGGAYFGGANIHLADLVKNFTFIKSDGGVVSEKYYIPKVGGNDWAGFAVPDGKVEESERLKSAMMQINPDDPASISPNQIPIQFYSWEEYKSVDGNKFSFKGTLKPVSQWGDVQWA